MIQRRDAHPFGDFTATEMPQFRQRRQQRRLYSGADALDAFQQFLLLGKVLLQVPVGVRVDLADLPIQCLMTDSMPRRIGLGAPVRRGCPAPLISISWARRVTHANRVSCSSVGRRMKRRSRLSVE